MSRTARQTTVGLAGIGHQQIPYVAGRQGTATNIPQLPLNQHTLTGSKTLWNSTTVISL